MNEPIGINEIKNIIKKAIDFFIEEMFLKNNMIEIIIGAIEEISIVPKNIIIKTKSNIDILILFLNFIADWKITL